MSEPEAEESGATRVDVCVCTFRRASLYDTLASLATQVGAGAIRIIVADNDDEPSAAPVAARARADLGLDIHYVHAPARNISVVRNACLDAAVADLIAFIDDDEVAPPGWLATLRSALATQKLDVVFGPVKAIYPANAPTWARAGDFHSFGPAIRADGSIDTGYSSNVLFRRAVTCDQRFDPALGKSGGEDTQFFAALHASGAKLGFAPDAIVNEPVPASRLSTAWLLRRSFRAGQSHARVLRDRGQGALTIAAPAAAKAIYCAGATLLTAWSPVLRRKNLIRGALHAGGVAKTFGAREPVLYGEAPEATRSA